MATVVVTGASAGVGRATAKAFAERGAALGLIARGSDRLEATVNELHAAGALTVRTSPGELVRRRAARGAW